jgi:putative ABC transport system substrate-binding protein
MKQQHDKKWRDAPLDKESPIQAVCGKAARTDSGGGRAMKRTSLPLRRRAFITLLGGAAAAWPLAARAQQVAMPVVGVLGIGSLESNAMQLASFRNGLKEQEFAEGQNTVIESRFAQAGQHDGLVSLASDLARLPVRVLVAIGNAGVPRAAKAATTTIGRTA